MLARACLVLALLCVATTRGAAAQTPVDLQLILAVDVSSSVDYKEFNLEIDGYVQAFRDPRVVKAIQAGPLGRIAVAMVQWSGQYQQKVAIDWLEVSSTATAERLATAIFESPRLMEGATALGEAVMFSLPLFDQGPFRGRRLAIDVSGDGMSNEGRPASVGRDEAAKRGVTINGLAIVNEEPFLEEHYRHFLITGPAAFVVVAKNFNDFADAILSKLIREITGELVSDADLPYPTVRNFSAGGTQIAGP
ncbi:MAG: DUF1194 domain-containing protein [Alphaproteobacteria bacterium]|nr:DUF1194 domain-containing protein [Alphaproteobacteria bacterium]